MHVVKEIKKNCSTCDHWMGLRALEESGFVYSLEDVEGFCKSDERGEFDRVLTSPMACCASWEKWSDILSCANFPHGNNARTVWLE